MLINNLNPLSLRQDTGALWENFILNERKKSLNNHMLYRNAYYWRTHNSTEELDYIEEYEGGLHGFEIKWAEKKWKQPVHFIDEYNPVEMKMIHRGNYREWILGEKP